MDVLARPESEQFHYLITLSRQVLDEIVRHSELFPIPVETSTAVTGASIPEMSEMISGLRTLPGKIAVAILLRLQLSRIKLRGWGSGYALALLVADRISWVCCARSCMVVEKLRISDFFVCWSCAR